MVAMKKTVGALFWLGAALVSVIAYWVGGDGQSPTAKKWVLYEAVTCLLWGGIFAFAFLPPSSNRGVGKILAAVLWLVAAAIVMAGPLIGDHQILLHEGAFLGAAVCLGAGVFAFFLRS